MPAPNTIKALLIEWQVDCDNYEHCLDLLIAAKKRGTPLEELKQLNDYKNTLFKVMTETANRIEALLMEGVE
jgi:hypothetical protein